MIILNDSSLYRLIMLIYSILTNRRIIDISYYIKPLRIYYRKCIMGLDTTVYQC